MKKTLLVFATILAVIAAFVFTVIRRPKVRVYTVNSSTVEVLKRALVEASASPVASAVRPSTNSASLLAYDGQWVRGWTDSSKWYNYGFIYMGKKLPKASKRHPAVFAVIDQMCGSKAVVMCGFSRLLPGAEIPTHADEQYGYRGWGATNNVLHVGLDVPEDGCALRVGKTVVTQQNGRAIEFCDSLSHSAWNRHASKTRTIFYLKIKH